MTRMPLGFRQQLLPLVALGLAACLAGCSDWATPRSAVVWPAGVASPDGSATVADGGFHLIETWSPAASDAKSTLVDAAATADGGDSGAVGETGSVGVSGDLDELTDAAAPPDAGGGAPDGADAEDQAASGDADLADGALYTLDGKADFVGWPGEPDGVGGGGVAVEVVSGGTDGALGNDGTAGNDGAIGTDGTGGNDGAIGTDGTSGNDGTIGNDGTGGNDGAIGSDGTSGNDGTVGSDGTSGNDGTVGSDGTSGNDGTIGSDGTSGNDGAIGNDGTGGNDGAIGSDGTSGNDGAIGNDGTGGNDGAIGADGTGGNDGAIGADGTVGNDGTIGSDGTGSNDGTIGSDGTGGNDGTIGSDGTSGNDGTVGSDGTTIADLDQDGTPAPADCDDFDPLIGPNAVEITLNGIDDNCNGKTDEPTVNCESAGDAVSATAFAQAIGMCTGLVAASFASGTEEARTIRASLGSKFKPQAGAQMAMLSTGVATDELETPGFSPQPGLDFGDQVPHPAYSKPKCGNDNPGEWVRDAMELKVELQVPLNATALSFSFAFFTAEYPEYVCTQYNDRFLVLLDSQALDPKAMPQGQCQASGVCNISYDSNGEPVTVNNAFFGICNAPQGATMCKQPATDLADSGYDQSCGNCGYGGAVQSAVGGSTGWLSTVAPVVPGAKITLRFVVFDEGDGVYDSAVLLDNFKWVTATAGTTPFTGIGIF